MLSVPESEFAEKCLESHNKFRALHGSAPLRLNETLSDYAQEWANDLASREVIEHRESSQYGENLYTNYSDDKEWTVKPSDPVESWYMEKEKYTFGEESPTNFQDVGHFTQIVWKESKELGVGVKFGENGHVYVVCNYDPPGNVSGTYDKNVLREDTNKDDQKGDNEEPRYSKDRKESLIDDLTQFPSKIKLTKSDEELGIRLVQPNQKLFNSMEKMAAVPSEKLRVWTVWLEKVSDESILWSKWLRGHIDLVIRIKSYLDQLDAGETEIEQIDGTRETKLDAADAEDVENLSRTESRRSRKDKKESIQSREKSANVVTVTEEAEIMNNDLAPESAVNLDEEKKEDAEDSNEPEVVDSDIETKDEVPGESEEARKESKEMTNKDTEKENSSSEINNKSWPIGVAWKPRKSQKRKEREENEKRPSFEKISMPKTKEEMDLLIKSVRHKATIYRSLHKHWLETGNQAVKEMLGRTVMPMSKLPFYSYEDAPYGFFLKANLDIAIGVEHEDEEVLLPDETRESVTKNYEHLYFNLLDKPGKGGKPWF